MHRFEAGSYLNRYLLLAGVVAALAYLTIYTTPLADAPIRSDGFSYYVYLPAWMLDHDPTLESVARDCCGGRFPSFTEIRRWPATDRWVNPHPIGVAILMLPFFGAAHALTLWSNLPPDGFSLYYQHAAGLAGLIAWLAGLTMLGRQLARHFSAGVTLATLTAITFGTNLFHYGVYDSTFSHAFSFALIAAFLDATDRWSEQPDWPTSIQLAVIGALIVMVRHTNALFLLVWPLANPRRIWARRRLVAGTMALAAVCVLPQLLVYRQATGRWLVSSYGQIGGFTFASPHLWGVLFSVEKGLFFWSPVLLFAVAGLFIPHPWTRRFRAAAAVIFLLDTYLIASWWDWQFGGSYGHRGFTDGLALAALFLAAFFESVAARPRVLAAIAALVSLLVALSVVQMLQYWAGVIPIANTTWPQYRELFLRFR